MDNIQTLTDLLKNSGCKYLIHDLGRRIQRIDNKSFAKIENGQMPYPYPLQRIAKFAISYWNEHQQPWIWFLKFELDERGLLKASDIGQFIKYVVEAMGNKISGTLSEKQQEKLANNPFVYTPPEDKMAVFHSKIAAELSLPASQYYEHTQFYFKGGLGWDKWQTVGIQGLADLCARFGQEQNTETLLKSLDHLPTQPLYALLGILEHYTLPDKIAKRLEKMTLKHLKSPDIDLFFLSALARALSGAKPTIINHVISEILANPNLCHQEVLIGIAGRSWTALTDKTIAELFLTRLAQTGNQTLFNQLFSDLVMQPSLRIILLPLLHTKTSPELDMALTQLQHQMKGQA